MGSCANDGERFLALGDGLISRGAKISRGSKSLADLDGFKTSGGFGNPIFRETPAGLEDLAGVGDSAGCVISGDGRISAGSKSPTDLGDSAGVF